MFNKTLAVLAMLAWVATAHAGETQASYQTAYDAAVKAQQAAAAVGHEWRDIGNMLKSAQAAADAGDFDKAVKLANQAERQGELGVEQAKIEEKIWRDRVLR